MDRRPLILSSLLAFIAGTAPDLNAAPGLSFPPRPRVLMSAPELKSLQSDPARDAERAKLLAQAGKLLESGLKVPVKEGNWIFYYACPDHNADLSAETDERHFCPVCKRVFEDERTIASYRTKLYNELERNLKTLASAYAASGDVKYAVPVREALLSLARTWPTLQRHDRWGRTGLLAVVGGRRFCQLLDEACSLINLAGVWDLVAPAPCLSDEDRALIEKQLFRMPAEELGRFESFTGSRNNHQTWFNAAYAVTGLALGDSALLHRAIDGDVGLRWQLEKSITSDGLWYEGALAYHFYALQAIMKTLDAAGTAGYDLSGDARLKSLWTGPLQMAYPSGQCPVFHDSDPASLSNYKPFFEWGARYFKDPALATGDPSRLGSTNLAGIGVGVLRRGSGAGASCLMLDYGLHGDGHGHPDKLNVVLYALGRELLLDPGRISYSVPEYKTWCRTTVAHNTVVLDGRDQKPDFGSLLFFSDTPAGSGLLAQSEGAYPGSTLRRFLILTDDLLIDVFSVFRPGKGSTDWIIHGRGAPEPPPNCTMTSAGSLPGQDGYAHLTGVSNGAFVPPQPLAFTFTLSTSSFWRVWLAGDGAPPQDAFHTGTGIGYNTGDKVPFLLRRRQGGSTAFVTVYDLSGQGAVTNVALLPVLDRTQPLPAWEAAAVRVDSAAGSRLFALDFSSAGARELSADHHSFKRWLIAETKDCEQKAR
jgi:hypothetical protein